MVLCILASQAGFQLISGLINFSRDEAVSETAVVR